MIENFKMPRKPEELTHEEKLSDTHAKWDLDPIWNERRMIIFVNGMPLDRHMNFQKKLSNIKLSFSKAFRISIVFQKSLSRVVKINVP